MSTEATLVHHIQAFGQGIDAIMTDYTPESVLFTPDGPLSGLEPIRAFFDNFHNTSPPELLHAMMLVRKDVHGDVAYNMWKAERSFLWRRTRRQNHGSKFSGACPTPEGAVS